MEENYLFVTALSLPLPEQRREIDGDTFWAIGRETFRHAANEVRDFLTS